MYLLRIRSESSSIFGRLIKETRVVNYTYLGNGSSECLRRCFIDWLGSGARTLSLHNFGCHLARCGRSFLHIRVVSCC